MTRVRSDGGAPQRLIHRRIGNQYSTENVRITNSVETHEILLPPALKMPPAPRGDPPLGKETGEFVADDLLLTEHQVASRFEADKPRAGDALGRALTRLVRGELVVFGVGDQGGHADGLEVVVGDIRVGYEEVEVETLGAHGEQTVDELVDEPGVLTGHGEPFRDRRHQADHR